MTLLDRATSSLNRGNLAEAEEICREILRLSPRTSEAYNILGIIYQDWSQGDGAVAAYHKAIELDPTNSDACFNLGSILGQRGDYQQAAAVLNKGLALAPRTAEARNNLGLALAKLGKRDEAISSLEKAVEIDPHYTNAWYNLGDTYCNFGELQKAVETYQVCIQKNPDDVAAHYNLGVTLHDMNRIPEAIESLQRTIELDPQHEAARHSLAALSGETPDSAPQQFVTNLFDQYSSNFETDLVNRLEYRIPTKLRELLSGHLPAETRLSKAADLGCGTGLSGQAFREFTDYLVGIDISKNMLDQAREKGVYDSLLAGDICEQLEKAKDMFDLFIATDVMVYIGNLEPLFSQVNEKANPGAYFALSVESLEDQDFILQPTGRYAHATDYIKRLADQFDFTVMEHEETGIRKEGDDWIPGEIFLLQKKSPS